MIIRIGRCRCMFNEDEPAEEVDIEVRRDRMAESIPSAESSTKEMTQLRFTTNMSTLGDFNDSSSSLSAVAIPAAQGLSSFSLISAQSELVRSLGTGKWPTKVR